MRMSAWALKHGAARFAVFGAVLISAATARSEEPTRVGWTSTNKSWIHVEGDSSLHRYTIDAKGFRFELGVDGATDQTRMDEALREGRIKRFDLSIPVESLRSGESKMDDNTRKALKSKEHPEIRFQMLTLQWRAAQPASDRAQLTMKGTLSIAGIDKPVELNVEMEKTAGGYRFTGHQELKMSDYGIKPPVLLGGMIRVADPVVVRFDVELALASRAP